MRIGYLIGALSPGGAERQLVELAGRIVERGHEVEVVCYDGEGSFDGLLQARGVTQRRAVIHSKRAKIGYIREFQRSFRPDLIHAFMKRASSLAVLANLPARRSRTVVSDYSTASYASYKPVLWASLVLFHFADVVVTETEMNRRQLVRLAPLLRRKVRLIRNGVDLERFRPLAQAARNSDEFRFLCVGSVFRVKNPVAVVEAVRLLREQTSRPFRLEWVGRFGRGHEVSDAYREAIERVERYRLGRVVSFSGETSRIEDAYRGADVLVHASLQEGMPNAVVEAMACGLPVIVSGVSDLPLLVEKQQNGIVCEGRDHRALARAMRRMLEIEPAERRAMALGSRRLAETLFDRDLFVSAYEDLYAELVHQRASKGPC